MNEYQQKLAKLFSDIETGYSLRLRLVQLVGDLEACVRLFTL